MKKTITNNTTQTTESLVAAVGMGFLLLAFPFVFRNGYIDITEVRFLFFTVLSAFAFTGCMLLRLLRRQTAPKLSGRFLKDDPLSAAFLLFLVSLCLSAALSDYRDASVTGSEGRYMGLLMYLALGMMFVWISRCFRLSVMTPILFCGVSSLITVFALLQFIGVDLFHLLGNIEFTDRRNFLSVFGNINVYAAYLSTTAPVAMLLSCFSEEKKQRILFHVFAFFGFLGLMTSNSDSCYIAFGTAFFILFLMVGSSRLLLRRYLLLLLELCGAMALFGLIFYAAGGSRGRSGITELLTTPPVPYVLAAVVGVFYWAATKFRGEEKRLRRIRIAVIAAVCLGAAALLGAILYFSVFNTAAEIGYPEKFLRFNDRWGTDRGYVWTRLIRIFLNSPLKEKLFGYGEETVAPILLRAYGREMISTLGYLFDNAHNEFLQYLLTTGLFGLASYLALLAAAWKTGFAKDAPLLKKALALAAAAYAAQSFFNLLQPITTPYLFMLLGLIGCRNVTPSTVIDTNQINTSTPGGHKTT